MRDALLVFLGAFCGLLGGWIGTMLLLAWFVIVGRITTRDIATACDKLIDEAEPEAVESVQRRRTL